MWRIGVLFLAEGCFIALLILFYRQKGQKESAEGIRRLKEAEDSLQRKKGSLRETQEQNAALERQVSELLELYELTKKVAATLEFQKVFAILCQILNSKFSFEKGYLFLLLEAMGDKNSPLQMDHIYSLKEGAGRVSPQEIPYLEEVLEEARKRKEAFQGKSHPFVAVPLWVKEDLISIIVCEKLPPEDSEKLTILSHQFALAIQKVKLYSKLQELAVTDGLTHLYSRRYFLERFEEELYRSKRHTLHLAFLMVDIDHFKQKNDQYGHLVGDVILKEVAELLKANVREIDLVGRYGGEEFSILLPDTGIAEALQVAERIRRAVEDKSFSAYDEKIQVTISMGVGAYPEDGGQGVELIESADSALYQAKQLGRNKVCAGKV